MIQRFLGVSIGALVTFVLLWFNHVDASAWATAAIVGAIASFFWPIVAGFFLARRARQRRDDAMQAEVAKQVAAQTKGPG
jgi:glucose uptake protein GlcU